jgi:hypothetical protein
MKIFTTAWVRSKRFKRWKRCRRELTSTWDSQTGHRHQQCEDSAATGMNPWKGWDRLYKGGPTKRGGEWMEPPATHGSHYGIQPRLRQQNGANGSTNGSGTNIRIVTIDASSYREKAIQHTETQDKTRKMSRTLSSMNSLRGPHARPTRAKKLKGIDAAPPISGPVQARYPHGTIQWQLGVGRRAGSAEVEGIYAVEQSRRL